MEKITKNNRLGILVVDKDTGKPVTGFPIVAMAEIVNPGAPKDDSIKLIQLGLLASDTAGYVSFDIGRPEIRTVLKLLKHIWVYGYGQEEKRIDALAAPDFLYGGKLLVMQIAANEKPIMPLKLNAIQNPNQYDHAISPSSFAVKPSMKLGEGGCEIFLPDDKAMHEFLLRQVVREVSDPVQQAPISDRFCRQPLEQKQPPPPARPSEGQGRQPITLCIRTGWVNEYKISWNPVGHSLGQLVYTLPLAPCESVNLAVIDWSRRDDVMRQEATSFREDLTHELRRDRTIEETVDASLREWQGGGSIMGGISGSSGSIVGAVGGAYSTSGGRRNVESETLQNLADRIVQSSTAIRNLQSTVVVSASQRERESIQTRIVTNHNHCHALTMMYYEVLRHFQVVTEWTKTRDVLLVQYPLVTFNEESALSHRLVLERALLDPRLLKCFNALAKKHCANLGITPQESAANDSDYFLESMSFVLDIVRVQDLQFVNIELDTVHKRVKMGIPEIIISGTAGGGFNQGNQANLTSKEELNFNIDSGRWSFGEKLLLLKPESPVRWSEIRSIQISTPDQEGLIQLAHVYAKTSEGADTWILYDGNLDNDANTIWPNGDQLVLSLPVNPMNGSQAEQILTSSEMCCVEQLLTHLRANRVQYSRAIWLNEDADHRAIRFDSIAYNHGTLLDAIENRPLAVYGDYVAFPRLQEEIDEFEPDLESETRYVVLPARGVFAEAKLGSCNSCEERDITRFWDWSESPCPDKAPEIAPIASASRAQETNVQPSAMPSPIVNIVNPPAAPDPVGTAAALNLLSTPNIFRDMSGIQELSTLLQSLVKGTVSLEEAGRQAQNIQNRMGNAGKSSGSGSSLVGGSAGRLSAQEQFDNQKVLDAAVKKGAITPEQYQALSKQLYENPQDESPQVEKGGGWWENITETRIETINLCVPYHPDYNVFRQNVARNAEISTRMIYRSNSEYTEEVLDRKKDLKHIHAGFTAASALQGQNICMEGYIYRDEKDYVLFIRFGTPDSVVSFPDEMLVGQGPSQVELVTRSIEHAQRIAEGIPDQNVRERILCWLNLVGRLGPALSLELYTLHGGSIYNFIYQMGEEARGQELRFGTPPEDYKNYIIRFLAFYLYYRDEFRQNDELFRQQLIGLDASTKYSVDYVNRYRNTQPLDLDHGEPNFTRLADWIQHHQQNPDSIYSCYVPE